MSRLLITHPSESKVPSALQGASYGRSVSRDGIDSLCVVVVGSAPKVQASTVPIQKIVNLLQMSLRFMENS